MVLLAGELAGFLLIIAVIWLNEIIDLPHLLFGAPLTPVNWCEALIESVFVIILASIVLYRSWKVLGELYHLSDFLPVCSGCRRIRLNGEWIPLESFMDKVVDTQVSHGMCPMCMISLYPEYCDSPEITDE